MNLSTEIHPGSATDTEPAVQLHALLHTAGVATLDHLGWIRVSGDDRVRWLNGMVTNSIKDLKPGDGCYNFVLSAQGRIQGTAYAFAQTESILLQTDRTQIPNLLATLDRFIIMDDVELTDITESLTGLALTGPAAASLLAAIDLTPEESRPLELTKTRWNERAVDLIHAHSPLVPRFELWTDAASSATLLEELTAAGAITCTLEALELLRILEGTPRYGTDIRDKELAQETGQTHALHFAKGCYLGQEIVERIRSRGNVHRTFGAFRLDGTLPESGAAMQAEGKPVGEFTSVSAIPLSSGPVQIALGYIRRDALDRAVPLTYPGGEASPLPLPIREP
jgi:folate-binding protein YgfZ